MGDDEPLIFDEDFVRAAAVREDDLRVTTKPSRASLREVKREARERNAAPPRRHPVVKAVVTTLLLAIGVVVVLSWQGAFDSARRPAARRQRPVVVPSFTPPPKNADVFAGTSFATWPVGGAGIVPPAPATVGTYGTAQVSDAYARTVAYLRAATLDERVVWTGDMAPVWATVDRRQSRDKPLTQRANRFARDAVRASASVRVNGFMKAERGPTGSLYVRFTYVTIYAARPAKGGEAELVGIRREGVLQFYRAGAGRVTAPWVAQSYYVSDHSDCTAPPPDDDYMDVVFEGTPPRGPVDSGPRPTYDVLDPTKPDPPGEGCVDFV